MLITFKVWIIWFCPETQKCLGFLGISHEERWEPLGWTLKGESSGCFHRFPLHLLVLEGEGEPFIPSILCCRERYSRHLVVGVLAFPAAAAIGNDPNHHNGSNNSPNDASIQSYVHGCCVGREELAGAVVSQGISTITALQTPPPDPGWVEATSV